MERLHKSPTGINGLDQILRGGLPTGRPTLFCGGPGCGKTAFAMEFLCRGAQQFSEPGLFVSFEEAKRDIMLNFASCEFGFAEALAGGKVRIESVLIGSGHSAEAGEFTLDGLLVRLEHWLNSTRARQLVLDSLDALFSGFSNSLNLRIELSRVFMWLKDKGITTVVTSERGSEQFTRHGLEEYVSDCVILLDHRIAGQVSKRRLRVIKYRGSAHSSDEFPFLVGQTGISILPITLLDLDSKAPVDFVSSGIEGLDDMLTGQGYYRGSTVLVSGGAGTGKSTIAACFAQSVCRKGGRSLYLAFEESASQLMRNLRPLGVDLEAMVKQGSLLIEPLRPSVFGLEEHLVRVNTLATAYRPEAVVMDPITSFTSIGDSREIKSMLTRLLDYMKHQGITIFLTSLTPGSKSDEETETEVSSLVDTWIIIRFKRETEQRRRQIYVHKARGIAHSQAFGELIFSESGIVVKPFLAGSAKKGVAP